MPQLQVGDDFLPLPSDGQAHKVIDAVTRQPLNTGVMFARAIADIESNESKAITDAASIVTPRLDLVVDHQPGINMGDILIPAAEFEIILAQLDALRMQLLSYQRGR